MKAVELTVTKSKARLPIQPYWTDFHGHFIQEMDEDDLTAEKKELLLKYTRTLVQFLKVYCPEKVDDIEFMEFTIRDHA